MGDPSQLIRAQAGLDEALLKLNTTSWPIRSQKQVALYYQNLDCYACPMRQLEPITSSWKNNKTAGFSEYILSSKRPLALELRLLDKPQDGATTSTIDRLCRLSQVELNNQASYWLEPEFSKLDADACLLRNIEPGECYWCPIGYLLGFVLLTSLLEWLWHLRAGRASRYGLSPSASAAGQQAAGDESQEEASEDSCRASVQFQEQQQHLDEINNENPKPKRRIEALDTFRGLTIAAMIMVNYGGAGYNFMEHAAWDGLRLADLVFPFFVYSMGASIAISIRCQLVSRGKPLLWTLMKILKRSLTLMALGLCLNSVWLKDNQTLAKLRLTGVLQRFAISYLATAVAFSFEVSLLSWIGRARQASNKQSWLTNLLEKLATCLIEGGLAIACLAIYLYMSLFFEFSKSGQCPRGYLGPGGETESGKFENCTGGAAAWLDRQLLGTQHLYQDRELAKVFGAKLTHDPEGLLGCSTSVLLTLFGLQAGKIMMLAASNGKHSTPSSSPSGGGQVHRLRLLKFVQFIVVLAIAALVAFFLTPINKKLWSLSFVLVAGASASLALGALYLLLDVLECHQVALLSLLSCAGKNPIALYLGHSLIHRMLPWHFAVDETSHHELLLRLAWSTLVWLLVAKLMAAKRLFIKL